MKRFLDAPKSNKIEIITRDDGDYVNLKEVYDALGKSTSTSFTGYKKGVKHYIEVGDEVFVKVSDVIPFIGRLRNLLGAEMYDHIATGDYAKEKALFIQVQNNNIRAEVSITKADGYGFNTEMRVILTNDDKYMLNLTDFGWAFCFSASYRDLVFSNSPASEKITIRNNDNSVYAKYVSFDEIKNHVGKRNFKKLDALFEAAKSLLPIVEIKERVEEVVKETKIGRVSGEFKTSEHHEENKNDDYLKQIEVLKSQISGLEKELKDSDETVILLHKIIVDNAEAIKTRLKYEMKKNANMIEFIDGMKDVGKEDENEKE